MPSVEVYTDGGCKPNPGPGGWGAVLLSGVHAKEISGSDPATTNNRMELTAAISALELLSRRCQVVLHTDSQYLRRGITEWCQAWKARGWRKADGRPVENEDLWRELIDQAARHEVEWRWIKGHRGHPLNERADQLARDEVRRARRAVKPTSKASRTARSADAGDLPQVQIVARGSALGVPGPAGYAAEIVHADGKSEIVSGGWPLATNNAMELWAVVAALQRMRRPSKITIRTCSKYVLDGASKWLARWEQKGWRTRDGRRVKNREIWQELSHLLGDHDITWVHDRPRGDERGRAVSHKARSEAEQIKAGDAK